MNFNPYDALPGRFVDRGLPPLGRGHGSTPKPLGYNGHEEATLVIIERQASLTLKDLPLHEPAFSMIWVQSDACQLDGWGEIELRFIVRRVVADVISLAGLTGYARDRDTQLGMTKLRPDIFVLVAGVPVGVVAVKRPSPTIMREKNVHGQLLDYMRSVRTYFGVEHVIGIVTTYTEWRFYWFKESHDYATADTCAVFDLHKGVRKEDAINSLRADDGGSDHDHDSADEEDNNLNITFTQLDDGDEDNEPVERDDSPRVLHGTRVYDAMEAGPELSVLLASIVYKMCKSPITPVRTRAPPSSIRVCMNQAQWFWARVPAAMNEINDAAMPINGATSFFLLRDLRGGVDGRAWRACTRSGIGCVIKFSQSDFIEDQRALLEAEAQIWHAAWGLTGVHVTKLAGHPALIMPYARGIKDPSDEDKQDVRKAIDEMVSSGHCHEDLAWRHVGRLGLTQHPKRVIFFDLANVSRVNADLPESVTAARAKMLHALALI